MSKKTGILANTLGNLGLATVLTLSPTNADTVNESDVNQITCETRKACDKLIVSIQTKIDELNLKINIEAKRNLVKFVNKMLSWDINKPVNVESIVNWHSIINRTKFLDICKTSWIKWEFAWKLWKIRKNLKKTNDKDL